MNLNRLFFAFSLFFLSQVSISGDAQISYEFRDPSGITVTNNPESTRTTVDIPDFFFDTKTNANFNHYSNGTVWSWGMRNYNDSLMNWQDGKSHKAMIIASSSMGYITYTHSEPITVNKIWFNGRGHNGYNYVNKFRLQGKNAPEESWTSVLTQSISHWKLMPYDVDAPPYKYWRINGLASSYHGNGNLYFALQGTKTVYEDCMCSE